MKNKKGIILRSIIYGIIAVLCLGGGILYTILQEKGVKGIVPSELESQFINTKNRVLPKLSSEKIVIRIEQLEGEILKETNDPDRALELRREVQILRNQLSEASELK